MQALNLDPTTSLAAEAGWRLGKIGIKQNDAKSARERFTWVTSAHPESPRAPDAWLSLGRMARAAKPALSMERYEELVKRYPASAEAKVARARLASIYFDKRLLDKAIAIADAVISDPAAPAKMKSISVVWKGQSLLLRWRTSKSPDPKDLENGIQALESVKTDFQDQAKEVAFSRLLLGIHYDQRGPSAGDESLRYNPTKSRAILEQAITQFPKSYFSWWLKSEIANSYASEKRWADAAQQCQRVLDENPPESWRLPLLYLKGDCQVRDEALKGEGIRTLEALARDYPDDKWGQAAKGRLRRLAQ